jgi:hypothetical protein
MLCAIMIVQRERVAISMFLALAIFDKWHALFDDGRAEVRWLKFDWRKASGRVILVNDCV